MVRLRDRFDTMENELVTIIKISVAKKMLEFSSKIGDDSGYVVKDWAKVWYKVLVEEGKNVNIVMNSFEELSIQQKKEALEEAVEKHFIKMDGDGNLHTII